MLGFRKFLSSLHCFSTTFPGNHGHVVLYATHLYLQGKSAASIATILSSIGYFHKLLDFPDPTKHFLVCKLLKSIRKHRPSSDVRLPVTKALLKTFVLSLRYLSLSSYKVTLFSTMFVIAFNAFLRPSEMCKSVHNLQFSDMALTARKCVLTFRSFKHHLGTPVNITLCSQRSSLCPVAFLHRFVQARGSRPGPLFCLPDGKPVSYAAFRQTLQWTLAVCSVSGKFTPHSFRIGAATHVASLGYPDQLIQRLGRWRSSAWISYVRRNNVIIPAS